jgi:class 3 adenylate cyclase
MEQKDYRLAAIMYTDIAGFSRMMEKDEAGTLEILTYHNELIAGIVERHHGTIIKTIGDALLIDFKNTVEALQSAMEIQDKLYAHNKENPGLPLLVRIGVHLGDIYFYENDALGEGINIAARLQSLARPGCICFSQDVYNLVLNKIEFRAEKLGKVSLKNITKEVHAYEITTPNVEFDPERDKARPGFKPGSDLDEEASGSVPVGGMSSSTGPFSSRAVAPAPAQAPAELPAKAPEAAKPQAERSYSEEGSRNLLGEIRRAILQDTKGMGRRMSVDEALERYSFYGVEAKEVIAAMADQGLLVKVERTPRPPEPPRGYAPSAPSFVSGFGTDGSGQFDPGAIKQNIQAAVHGIVNEIERSVQQSMSSDDASRYADKYKRYAERYAGRSERHRERHEIKDAIRREAEGLETGRWDKKLMEDENWKPGPEELSRDFDAYKRNLETRCRKQRGGLVGNLASFVAVNGFLWYLNLSTSASFLWAAIVSAAWGIGVVSSAVAAKRAGEKLREIDTMPDLDAEQLADYKKLNRVKDSMAQHRASTIMVILLLMLINFLTGPHFPWSFIPSAALVFGLLAHRISFAMTKPRLERKLLDSLGIKGGWRAIFSQGKRRREDAVGLGPYAELYREAENAKDAIENQLRSGSAAASGAPVDADLAPTLDQYLGQVRLLAQSANEIDRLVEGIPMADLSKDKATLVAKRESAASESLKAEYGKSIEEIDKQESSYQELKEQSEVVRLRLGSSVNQLKQMRLDIARVQASPGAEGAAGIAGLKRRTDELSRYLEDLRSGYAEGGTSTADPFAELEEAERKRIAEAERAKGEIEGPKESQ